MKCENFADMLDNYECLSDEEKALMNSHACSCADCKKELDFMLSIITATKTLPEISVPDDFLDKLNARIDAEEVNVYKSNRIKIVHHLQENWRKYSAVAACMLLAAVIGTNYNMMLDRMEPVINDTVIESAAPVKPDNKGEAAVKATETKTDNQQTETNAERNSENNHDIGFKVASVPEVTPDNAVTEPTVQNVPAVNAEKQIVAENNTEEKIADNQGNFALQHGRYIESRMNPNTPEPASSNGEDISYHIAETDIAVAANISGNKDGIAAQSDETETGNEDDYKLSNNKLVISSDDYGEAMDIIERYLLGEYDDEYFVVHKAEFDRMLNRLKAEGIGFDNYVSEDSNEITFRVMAE